MGYPYPDLCLWAFWGPMKGTDGLGFRVWRQCLLEYSECRSDIALGKRPFQLGEIISVFGWFRVLDYGL